MTAFGYVRKSVMPDATKTLSPQVQEQRIRALASAHGDQDLVVLSDLDVSGAKVEERHEYMRLLDAIESGEAHSVYAFDLSRLHRNTREALRFFEVADAHKVPVRLVGDNVDTSTATGRMVLTMLSAINAMVSQQTSEKTRASLALKRAGGWVPGGHVYGTRDGEDVQAVIDAYRTTESPFKAAIVLNQDGVPTRNGKTHGGWSASAVRSVVRRNAPDLLIDPANRGMRGSKGGDRKHRFARLLRCSECGLVMTGSIDGVTPNNPVGTTRYVCHAAVTLPHGRSQVTEAIILDAIQQEVDHMEHRVRRLRVGKQDDEALLVKVEEERARVKAMYRKGHMDEPEYDAAMTELKEQESRLSALRWIKRIHVPPNLATGDPTVVNSYLRHLLEVVVVDMHTPGKRGVRIPVAIEATWRDPSLRGNEVADVA